MVVYNLLKLCFLVHSTYEDKPPTLSCPDGFRNFVEEFKVPTEPLNLSPKIETQIPQQTAEIQIPVQPENDLPSHVPNYQQTPPEHRTAPVHYNISGQDIPIEVISNANILNATIPNANIPATQPTAAETNVNASAPPAENVVHILPETLVSGAVNVASSAINTARSVINMIRPTEVR